MKIKKYETKIKYLHVCIKLVYAQEWNHIKQKKQQQIDDDDIDKYN